jgi:pimeloyl-ACP methyl ester carboxylesterase
VSPDTSREVRAEDGDVAVHPITTLIEGGTRMTTDSRNRGHLLLEATRTKSVAFAALVALLAASALMLGPGRADAASPTSSAAKSRSGAAAIAWRACGKRLDCARVRVPLDWSRARAFRGRPGVAGPTISIAVIRYRASRPKRRIGSLFVNYGGPGVPGVATVRGLGETLDKLARGRFDIVGWDPRGTGESTHVSCFADDRSRARFWGPNWTVPTTPAESRAYVPKTIEFAERCAARNDRLLEHISTADTVRDLDHLRKLVGDRKLNYRGLSYGTFLGQTYANMFPKHVRSMILDSVLDPVLFTTSLKKSIAAAEADSDLVLEKFMSLCEEAGPARCELAGKGPVAARVGALLERLRRGPIPAPSTPAPHQLSYGDALIAYWLAEGTPANWPTFAAALDQAADGDGSALKNSFAENKGILQEALDPATALQCADKPVQRRGAVQAWPNVVGPISKRVMVAPVDLWWLWAPCASWRARSADRYTGPWNATTKNPILVLSNRYDPRTAYANARRAARRLGNAVLVTNNGYGHTTESDPSTCIDTAVGRYLTTLATPRSGTVCQPDGKPFEPGFGEPGP